MDVLTSVVVPGVRRGLKQSTDIVKKGFVALLAFIIKRLGKPTEQILKNINMNIITNQIFSSSSSSSSLISSSSSSTSLLSSSIWTQLNETYHADLYTLFHEDPEQNFFENVNHIQIHRRVRAFSKLRIILKNTAMKSNSPAFRVSSSSLMLTITPNTINDNSIEEHSQVEELSSNPMNDVPIISEQNIAGDHSPIGIASLTHVLLPIALHPLVSDEFQKKDHLTLLQESAAFIGSIGTYVGRRVNQSVSHLVS